MTFNQTAYMREYRRSYFPEYRGRNRDRFRKYDRDRHNRVKTAAFTTLGGVCVLCGEDELEFLTVDHVNGDGSEDRALRSRREIYISIVRDEAQRKKFRLLCRNCNSGDANKKVRESSPQSVHAMGGRPCSKCGRPKLVRTSSHPKYGSRKRSECRHCQKDENLRLRLRALKILGAHCVCCGEDNSHKLTTDHIHNDGSSTRKRDRTGTRYFYKKVVEGRLDLSRFQTLCWNCNFSKHLGDGVCVHMRQEAKE